MCDANANLRGSQDRFVLVVVVVATYVATYVESMGCSHLLQLSRHRQTAGELSWVISHVACIGYLKRIVVVSSESIVA